MDEVEVIKTLGQWASGIGATGILVFVLYRLETGKYKTEGHHKEVVAEKEKSEERAWEMVDKLTEARMQDNAILEKFSESIRDLREAVNSLRSTIENQRARR